MQLIAPVRVLAVLELESLGQGHSQRDLAAVFAHGAAQDGNGVVVPAPCCVVPPLDGDGRELDVATGDGMSPRLVGKAADRRLEQRDSDADKRPIPRRRATDYEPAEVTPEDGVRTSPDGR